MPGQALAPQGFPGIVYIKRGGQTGDQDDLISIGTIGLIKGISTFKADKNVRLAQGPGEGPAAGQAQGEKQAVQNQIDCGR